MTQSTKHNTLNSKQIRILKLIFKFRFITASLLQTYKESKSLSSMIKALRILQEQKYIERRYTGRYRLQGKAARYYLTREGLTFLRKIQGMNETSLHAMRNNRSVTEDFADHHLDVFNAFLNISTKYPETFNIYTKYELSGLDYFPKPAPDLYLSRITPLEDSANDYFLDIYTDTQFFIIKKRIEALIEHYETGDWESENKTNYPTLLIACPDSRSEAKLLAFVEKSLDNAGIDDLYVLTTTTKALLSSDMNSTIWSKTTDRENAPELFKL